MSNKTIQSVSVETKENKLARLRREYVLVEWPKFLSVFPGMPGFVSDGFFEQKAMELLELSHVAQVSITGSPWDENDLDALYSRPKKDFIQHLRSDYNRKQLANAWRSVRDLMEMDT